MSALDDLKNKRLSERTELEEAILYGIEDYDANKEVAAQQLADKDAELLALRERVEKMAVVLQWIYDDGEGGTYRPDIQAVLVAHNKSQ